MKNIAWTLFWIVTAATIGSAQAQTTLYFAQVADGTAGDGTIWGTGLVVTNPASLGSPAASGTITFTKDDGTPLSVTLGDEQGQPVGSGSSISFQISGGQTRIFVTIPTGQALNNGFATVTSTLPITGGAAFYEYLSNGTRIGSAAVPAASPLTQQAVLVLRTERTAFAAANVGTTTANITFQLLDKNGVAAAPIITRTLPPGNHAAFFVNQLFPTAPQRFYGTVRITSSTPVVGTALVFEDQFYTIPVFPLP